MASGSARAASTISITLRPASVQQLESRLSIDWTPKVSVRLPSNLKAPTKFMILILSPSPSLPRVGILIAWARDTADKLIDPAAFKV